MKNMYHIPEQYIIFLREITYMKTCIYLNSDSISSKYDHRFVKVFKRKNVH